MRVTEVEAADRRRAGLILKISIFATGCAGIVAEFVLSTLATYLLGNAVFQWTIIMSLMLFAMGLGSRLSKLISKNLLDVFIFVEFSLSICCAISAVAAFGLAAWTSQIQVIIYILAMAIGMLIGFEIPLVTRLNENYEELRVNIANIMEKDYFGSLVGGFFFAFFALPYLGLTYTPIILGTINFLIACLFVFSFFGLLVRKKTVLALLACCTLTLLGTALLAKPILLYGEQKQYKDKIIYSEQTPYQKIIFTRWKEDIWLFLNGQEQFSSYDEERYHEPLVHPAMLLAGHRSNVLILGGGDGLALREIWKHQDVKKVTMVDLDPAVTRLAREYKPLVALNQNSMNDQRLKVVHQDAARFLRETNELFDVIIIDLPDPDSIDLMHLYSRNFYQLVGRHLTTGGVMVSQATSPWFAKQAFLSIYKTVQAAGFTVLPYHNQIPTMGEWAWVLGVQAKGMDTNQLKEKVLKLDFNDLPSRFLDNDAMVSMGHFSRDMVGPQQLEKVEVNSELSPVLYRYYASGSWDVY
ncbi:MAG: polyamine aminopropyltransferase [Thermodesulfobacteriota bacterium]